jgi:ribosomal protein L19E
MIVQMESIKLIEKKLKNIQEKMGIRDEEYLMLYRKFESDCAKSKS